MPKQTGRWPIWKIATASAGCAAVSGVLFWLRAVLEKVAGQKAATPSGRVPALTFSGFIMMMATAAGALCVLSAVWMAVRIREARTPPWKRHRKKKGR